MFRILLELKQLRLILLVVLFVCTKSLAFAQTENKINWQRMQRDLDIMESILDKMLTNSSLHWGLRNNNSVGIYCEGYGVILRVNSNQNQMFLLSSDHIEDLQIMERNAQEYELQAPQKEPSVVKIFEKQTAEELQTSTTNRIKEIKQHLVEFISDYADAIGQLKSSDNVTILVNLGKSDLIYTSEYLSKKNTGNTITLLEATAVKKDLIEYRRGNINEQAFQKRIQFRERAQNDKMRKNIDIMANIMNTALSNRYQHSFSVENKTDGIYLDGLGVLFFMTGYLENDIRAPIELLLDKNSKGQEIYIPRTERKQKSQEKLRLSLKEYKDALVEVVRDYGHTLRTIKSNESVLIVVDFGQVWESNQGVPERLIMKIQKKVLDSYNSNNLNLADFRKKVEFIEY